MFFLSCSHNLFFTSLLLFVEGKFLFRTGVASAIDLGGLASTLQTVQANVDTMKASIGNVATSVDLVRQENVLANSALETKLVSMMTAQMDELRAKFDEILQVLNNNITVDMENKISEVRELIDENTGAIEEEVARAQTAEGNNAEQIDSLLEMLEDLTVSHQNLSTSHDITSSLAKTLTTSIQNEASTSRANEVLRNNHTMLVKRLIGSMCGDV
jgi:hypothetical protein